MEYMAGLASDQIEGGDSTFNQMLRDIENLKCCANCKCGRQHSDGCCTKGRIVLQDEVCKEWEHDGARYEDRDIKL